MKRKIFLIVAGSLLVYAGCRKFPAGGTSTPTSNVSIAAISLPTLKCNICVTTVKTALASVEGIGSAEVHLKEKNATVHYLPAKLDVGKLEAGISKAGYDANDIRRDSTAYENLPECCK